MTHCLELVNLLLRLELSKLLQEGQVRSEGARLQEVE